MKKSITTRIVSFAAAAAVFASVTADTAAAPSRVKAPTETVSADLTALPAVNVSPLSSESSEEPKAPIDEGARALEKLQAAVSDKNSADTIAMCDQLTELLEEELREAENYTYSGTDPELIEKQESFENAVKANAETARLSLANIRKGIGTQSDFDALDKVFGETIASHKSNATANIVEENTAPEAAESTDTAAKPSAPADPPTAEELEYATDTNIPDSVKNLAKELGSAQAIYAFVKNNIAYESYSGSKKGAFVTLEQLGGNDIDQACLLISMLRAINIPARYVSGTVELTAEQAVAITGASDAESAGRVLSARYKDVKSVTNNGKLTGYRMEQTWAEAYLPYTDYRGAGKAAGDSMWIQLDPSFKELKVTEQELELERSENSAALMRDIEAKAEMYPALYREDYSYTNKLKVYFRNIVETTETYLPLSLPYTVISEEERYTVIPDSKKDRLTIEIGGEKLLDADLPDLYFKQITVSYEPATDADKAEIEKYEAISAVPTYLVNVVPVVTVRDEEGQQTYVGKNKAQLGSMQKMMTTVSNEGGTTILDDDVFCGSMYAINLNYQMINVGDADFAQARVKEAEAKAVPGKNDDPEVLGAFLDYAGKYYFALCDSESVTFERVYNVNKNRQLGLAITGYEFRSGDVLGVSSSLDKGSFFIDAAYNSYSAVSYAGNKRDEIDFNMALSASESYHEGDVWERITDGELKGISTVALFDEAKEKGIDAPFVFAENAEEQLALCSVSDYVKDEVRDFVNQGYVVRLLSENMEYNGWYGTGYIVTDLRTGSSSYMLADGTAGGKTDLFDMLYEMNMILFKVNLAVAAVSLCSATVKLHCVDPTNIISGAKEALDAGQAIGRAFSIYYDTAFWIYDCTVGGPEKLEEFYQFTMKNKEATDKYISSVLKGKLDDIMGGIRSMLDLGTVNTIINAKDNTKNISGIITNGASDEWFEEFETNPYELVLQQIMNLIGHAANG